MSLREALSVSVQLALVTSLAYVFIIGTVRLIDFILGGDVFHWFAIGGLFAFVLVVTFLVEVLSERRRRE